MNELNLNSFLKLGYFLGYRENIRPVDVSRVDPQRYVGADEEELLREGLMRLRTAITSCYKEGCDDVVPLSGGLDSRAILSVLRECRDVGSIRTYTFGTPGTLDYEIGNRIAAHLGTRHTRFPLTDHHYTLAELQEASRLVRGQTYLFHHPPVFALQERFANAVIWSGYIGDFFVGSHLPAHRTESIEQARLRFIRADRFVRSMELSSLSDEAVAQLVDTSGVGGSALDPEEQIFLDNHIRVLTANHILLGGFEYRTPYLDPEWIGFAMSVGEQHRRGQRLWKRILSVLDPELFSLPTKGNGGAGLLAGPLSRLVAHARLRIRRTLSPNGPSPFVNFLDWNTAFRTRPDFQALIPPALKSLKRRKIVDWLDVEEIWHRHQRREGDHADALIVLTSLEVHLQTGAALYVRPEQPAGAAETGPAAAETEVDSSQQAS